MITNPHWRLTPQLFNGAECDAIIALAMKVRGAPGDMTWKNEQQFPEVRSSTLRWLYRNWPEYGWIFNTVDIWAAECDAHFGTASLPNDSFQFTEYQSSRRGHYDWHHDSFGAAQDRVLSICIQLSEPSEYEGGRLELRCPLPPPWPVMMQRGAAIAFRGSLEHRVSHTFSGRRFSLVAWRLGETAAMHAASGVGEEAGAPT